MIRLMAAEMRRPIRVLLACRPAASAPTVRLLLFTVAALALTVPSAGAIGRSARITKNGLGSVRIGMTVSQVEAANGREVSGLNNNAGGGDCYSGTLGSKVYALFTGDILTRIYVNTSRYRTRKGIHVGSTAAGVYRRYGSRLRSAPHAYVPGGRYLTVTTGRRRVLFETSNTGRVTSISTGRAPEVDYIEGCA